MKKKSLLFLIAFVFCLQTNIFAQPHRHHGQIYRNKRNIKVNKRNIAQEKLQRIKKDKQLNRKISKNKRSINTNKNNIIKERNQRKTGDKRLNKKINRVNKKQSRWNRKQDTKINNNTTNINTNKKYIEDNTKNIQDLNNRVNDLEETQQIVGLQLRVHDSRKWQVNLFADYSVNRNKVDRTGIRFQYKFGKSYEEKLIEELVTTLNDTFK